MHSKKTFPLLLALFLLARLVFADQTPVLERTGKQFDPSIPTLKSVLGFDFGERITSHSQMETYLAALAKASSRIKMEKIGETYEGRALYYLLISSPENISRLEDLRVDNLKLTDPRITSESEARGIIENHPVWVGLSYSVHGDEHSGVEAGLAMAYYLLASNDPETLTLLKNCVVLIDPMQNPDGRQRFIDFFYSTIGKNPSADINSAEHNEVWPGGRENHYLFDMNRDWTVLSQKETLARIQAYRKYRPQIYIDLHEMGENSTYFFPPPSMPHNPNLPQSMEKWWQILGKAVGGMFDQNNIRYYSMEHFEFWYPGYGDSWPAYNGAVAGTYEQGSVRGLVVKRKDGVTVDYKDAIWHHFLSSLATCKMGSDNRKAKLQDFYDFHARAVQEGRTGSVREYIFPRSSDPSAADRLVEKLLWQGIEVKQADCDFKGAAGGYMNDKTEPRNFQKGDYVVTLDQPLKHLIQVVLEKEQPFNKSFLEQEEKRKENREHSEIYDITAWSLPLAYNIESYWSAAPLPSCLKPVTQIVPPAVAMQPATYAYLLNYTTNQNIAAVMDLLNSGVRVYFSRLPFTQKGRSYRAGSFVIFVKDNPPDLQKRLTDIAKRTGISFDATETGWTEEGPDLGSSDIRFLEKPRVAVLTNNPTDPAAYGTIAYLFDQRYNLPFTAIQTYILGDVDLNDYNVLILPSDGWQSYSDVFTSNTVEKLKPWLQSGGTLIAIQGAASFLIDNGKLTKISKISRFLKNTTEAAPEKEEKKDSAGGGEEEKPTEAPDYVMGSIARGNLNLQHFLGYGYSSAAIPVFVYSDNVFVPPVNSIPVVAYADADKLKVAGHFWEITKKRLEHKAYLTEEPVGKGHVILFAEDPNFRAYWEGLTKLFFNGILFGPSLNGAR